MSPRVLVVVNSPTSGPRRLGRWLCEEGVDLDERLGRDGLPATIAGYDGLVMLGGGFMPDEDSRAPWLVTERNLAAQAVATDLPTLGICLGAQVLAHVAGGRVRAQYGPTERGATVITATPAGRDDPVTEVLAQGAPMIENHRDLITELPPDADLLASSQAVANQAFRLGSHVRALQFHPEACAEDLLGWDEAALSGEGIALADLVAAARRVDAENTAAARAMITGFAAEVSGGSGVSSGSR